MSPRRRREGSDVEAGYKAKAEQSEKKRIRRNIGQRAATSDAPRRAAQAAWLILLLLRAAPRLTTTTGGVVARPF